MPTSNQKKKIILFEYDRPIDRQYVLPYASGIWSWRMTNVLAGYGNGYYEYQQPARWLVRSVKHGELDLIETASYSAMLGIDNSFYYDQTTTFLYLHLELWDAPSANLIVGVATGFSMNADNPYYNDTFYEPRITKVPAIKKSIDPLFFGVLKYQASTVEFDNRDGFFDNWRSLNLYGQKGRILVGEEGDDYSDFQQIADGFLSDDARTFSSFSLKLQDTRKGLTQPIAINKYTKAEYPFLSDDDVDKVKPVIFGPLQQAPCVCLNATQTSPSLYLFSYGDAEGPSYTLYGTCTAYNVQKNITVTVSPNYFNSTFTLSVANATDSDGNLSEIRVTLSTNEASNFTDSAKFIRRLMQTYDGKPPVDTFYDADSITFDSGRDTALYIDDASTSLSDAIEKICYDNDLRFFPHDDGKYCIREYKSSRAPSATIKAYDWTNGPEIKNSGSEYLSSCIIKYKRNESDDTYSEYDSSNLGTYRSTAYNTYKKYASKTFETGLYYPVSKANTIMSYSSNVKDIITRSTTWDFSTLEITDFVYCDPYVRTSETESPKVYEILGIDKNPEKSTVQLTLRYVRDTI